MAISSFRLAKSVIEKSSADTQKGGYYQQLTSQYLGEANYIAIAEKTALRNIFIKFADLLNEIGVENIHVALINSFIKNLLCLAQIYFRQKTGKAQAKDENLFSKAQQNLKTVIKNLQPKSQKNTEQLNLEFEMLGLEAAIESLDGLSDEFEVMGNQIKADIVVSNQLTDVNEKQNEMQYSKACLILGIAITVTVATGICMGLSLGTDIIPDVSEIWSSSNSKAIAKASAAATPSLFFTAGLSQTGRIEEAGRLVMRT